MWHIHTMDYYSLLKRKEILTHGTTWVNPENAECKKPGTKDHVLHDSVYMKCPKYATPWRHRVNLLLLRVQERRLTMGMEFLFEVMKMVWINNGCTTGNTLKTT